MKNLKNLGLSESEVKARIIYGYVDALKLACVAGISQKEAMHLLAKARIHAKLKLSPRFKRLLGEISDWMYGRFKS